MSDASESLLWNEFALAENDPDPGGGILYAIRYDTENLLEHRTAVVAAINDSDIAIFETEDDRIAIDASALDEEETYRVRVLLEELSVINGALEYHEVDVRPDSIEQLSSELRSMFIQALFQNFSRAFDVARLGIDRIVKDIGTAQTQNQVLSAEEYQVVQDLGEFASRRAREIANNEITIIMPRGRPNSD